MKPHVVDSTYHSYLLRCWPLHQPPGPDDWRFTLVHPYTNAHRTFPTPAALVDFLQTQLGLGEVALGKQTSLSNQIDD